MTLEEAKNILKMRQIEISENEIFSNAAYLFASKNKEFATLDGEFTAKDLEAIFTWMKS